ncbi:MAG TPA: tRNA (adenosine(37)-N6)-threonylcarbamoyltransferase complex ATPase subunit type 1 TsaE [Chryseolinea sp.]|nr:tRNA (adenosine(37)-N6)-threonylcarbamoyltransferase complex ATPase subunit type 1 TsaE [Chryseolinea sp.]
MTAEELVFRTVGLSELSSVAGEIAKRLDDFKVWLFYGPMGAGKTTLIKAIGNSLGVQDPMSSPTFAIVNEYETESRDLIYHFDFYRIRNEVEAYDIGTDEYFYSGNACFIEWPEKIPSLIPSQHGKVTIQTEDNTHRTIVISVHDGKEKNRV